MCGLLRGVSQARARSRVSLRDDGNRTSVRQGGAREARWPLPFAGAFVVVALRYWSAGAGSSPAAHARVKCAEWGVRSLGERAFGVRAMGTP